MRAPVWPGRGSIRAATPAQSAGDGARSPVAHSVACERKRAQLVEDGAALAAAGEMRFERGARGVVELVVEIRRQGVAGMLISHGRASVA